MGLTTLSGLYRPGNSPNLYNVIGNRGDILKHCHAYKRIDRRRRLHILAIVLVACSTFLTLTPTAAPSPQPQPYRLGPQHHHPRVLGGGRHAWYVEQSVTNHWMYRPREYIIDGEVYQALLQHRSGLGRHIEIGLDIPVRYFSGGILDRFIERFHRLFGFDDSNRSTNPRQDLGLQVYDWPTREYLTYVDRSGLGWSLAKPVLELTYAPPGLPIDIAFHAFYRLPLTAGEVHLTELHPSAGASLAIGQQLGPWYLSAGPGVGYITRDDFIGVALRRWILSLATSVEFRPARGRHSVWVHGLIQTGAAQSFPVLSEKRYQMMLGYSLRLTRRMQLEIGVLENAIRFDNTPDFGIHVGLSRIL